MGRALILRFSSARTEGRRCGAHRSPGGWPQCHARSTVGVARLTAKALLYLRQTRARDRIGSIGLWSLVGFLVLAQAGSIAGPPPPSVSAMAWGAEGMWLLVAFARWVDRHREPCAT